MKYVFTENMFSALLAVCDAGNIYTFKFNEKMSDRELLSSVQYLYCRGFLVREEDVLVPSKKIKPLLDILKTSQWVYSIYVKDRDYPDRLIYTLGDSALLLERCISYKENTVKISMNEIDDILDDIKDDGFGQNFTDFLDPGGDFLEAVKASEKKALTESDNIKASIKRISCREVFEETLLTIKEMPFYDWMIYKTQNKEEAEVFNDKRFLEILKTALKGEAL